MTYYQIPGQALFEDTYADNIDSELRDRLRRLLACIQADMETQGRDAEIRRFLLMAMEQAARTLGKEN